MSALVSPPDLGAFPRLHEASATASPESPRSASQVAQVLCGSGLLLYGLLRGSWLGMTLAAAGGFLLFRGLSPSPKPADRRLLPSHDDLPTGRDWSPAVVPPPADVESPVEQDRREYADAGAAAPPASFLGAARSEALTPEEHGEAEVAAYYRALHRGGGRLPPYEYSQAAEDFCWAAGMVFRQRFGE